MNNDYIRSDLALESLIYAKEKEDYHRKCEKIKNITIETFEILRKKDSFPHAIGKYIEISFKDFSYQEDLIEICTKQLRKLIQSFHLKRDPFIMIVGLGNEKLTSDSIGVKTLHLVQSTHHYSLEKRHQEHLYDSICITPGVMGKTGVETADYISALKEEFKPDLMIVIDALCAKSYEKIGRVIQMNNVGLYPGSGIGNHRKAINNTTMDIPVIAVGIPTVIHVSSLMSDVFEIMEGYFHESMQSYHSLKVGKRERYEGVLSVAQKELLMGELGKLDESQREHLFFEILSPLEKQMVLCDKGIDFDVEVLSKILSKSINQLRY